MTEHRISAPHDQGGRVEIGRLPDGGVSVRAGGPPHGPVLTFTQEEWAAFAAGVKNGEFDPEQAWTATGTTSPDR